MSQRDNRSTQFTNRHGCYQEDNVDDHCSASESSFFRPKKDCIIDIPSFPDEEKRTDNDSGIYNSSKATTSLCSNSDQDESEGEERAASFDYFPCSTTTKITPMYHNEYDEAYDVESEKGSQNDIESPRSDKSGNRESDPDYYQGTEMKTFRKYSREQDDFETDDDSDEEVQIAPHRKLYNERRSRNYYTPMTQENYEEYDEMSSSHFSFENSRKALKDKSGSSLRSVDDSIHFGLNSPTLTPSRYSNYSRYSNNSSAGVRVEKSMYSRHDMDDSMFSGAKDPPFGRGKDPLDKVGNSICHLLSNSSSKADDMPEGRPISQSLDLADDGKKKKKKKRGSKDDLDDKARRNSYNNDENGNPIGERYYQMRSSPKPESRSVIHKNHYLSASSLFPNQLKDFNSYSHGGTTIGELDSSFHSGHESNRAEKKLKRKVKKEKVSLSEEIENYVGNKGIDELLDFIESDKNARKPKRNGPNISNDVTVVSKTTEKNNKKNKERKINKSTIEEKCKGQENDIETSEAKIVNETTPLINSKKSEFADYKTHSVQNHNVEKICVVDDSHLKNNINKMGNSTGKTSSDEKSDSHEQLNVEKTEVKDDIKLPVTEIKITEKDVEDKSSEILPNDTDKQVKKDKKTMPKSVEKQNQTNKTKTKGVNSGLDNNVNVNGVETDLLLENNSAKLKTQKVKNSEKSMNKGKTSNDHALTSPLNNNNKDTNLSLLNELDLAQNDFRFTDFEPWKKEPEFTVVGKKKKKLPTAKEVMSMKESLLPPKPMKREERRKVSRSVTPPPLNKLSSNIEGDRTRDLSPSAFPALISSNKSSFRDARRNSTGDVRTDVQSIIKAQDDSDIESVKSLPASSQGVWGQSSLSPRLPVSYAKMAASPKPSVTSLGSSTTEEESGETSMDLKSTKWKGQIKERRHSIGSHPENMKETESSGIKQKFGSQEVLNHCDQDVLIDSDLGYSNGFRDESRSVKTEESNTSLCSTISFVNDSLSDTNINNQLTTLNSERARQNNLNFSQEIDKSSELLSNPRKNHEMNNVEKVKSTKQTVNNSKRVKQSVIFMDKRVSQVPPNLGISFFFDSENESSVTGDSEIIQKCSSNNLQNNPNTIPKSSDSKNLRNNNSSDHSSVIDCGKTEQGNDFSSRSHTLAGKNGVVDHMVNLNVQNKNHPHNDDAIIFISEHNQLFDAAPISSDSKLSNNSKQQLKLSHPSVCPSSLVLVLIGDRLEVEPNSSPKDVKCKQQLYYRQESGDATSNQRFNFPEAIVYLYKEWEKALDGNRRDPNEVVMYKS